MYENKVKFISQDTQDIPKYIILFEPQKYEPNTFS